RSTWCLTYRRPWKSAWSSAGWWPGKDLSHGGQRSGSAEVHREKGIGRGRRPRLPFPDPRPAGTLYQSVGNRQSPEDYQVAPAEGDFVTNEADSHPDHRASFWFVRDAARGAGYRGISWTWRAARKRCISTITRWATWLSRHPHLPSFLPR